MGVEAMYGGMNDVGYEFIDVPIPPSQMACQGVEEGTLNVAPAALPDGCSTTQISSRPCRPHLKGHDDDNASSTCGNQAQPKHEQRHAPAVGGCTCHLG